MSLKYSLLLFKRVECPIKYYIQYIYFCRFYLNSFEIPTKFIYKKQLHNYFPKRLETKKIIMRYNDRWQDEQQQQNTQVKQRHYLNKLQWFFITVFTWFSDLEVDFHFHFHSKWNSFICFSQSTYSERSWALRMRIYWSWFNSLVTKFGA